MWDNPAFNLYAMEQEGLLETHESKINKIIKSLRARGCPKDTDSWQSAFAEVGYTFNDVTNYDMARISEAVG